MIGFRHDYGRMMVNLKDVPYPRLVLYMHYAISVIESNALP